jgi:ribose transport system substrate-binding protein
MLLKCDRQNHSGIVTLNVKHSSLCGRCGSLASMTFLFFSTPTRAVPRVPRTCKQPLGFDATDRYLNLRFELRCKLCISWLCSGLLLFALTLGCRSQSAGTIAVIPETTGTQLWEAAHAGAVAAGGETGLHIYWNAPTREDDVERQIALVEKAIEDERVGLVLAPAQYLALVGPVREAVSKHMPTVIIRSPLPIPPGRGLSYILNDESEMGSLAAMRIGMLLHGEGRVAMLGLDTNMSGIIFRSRAFEAVLASKFPKISIVERSTNSSDTAEVQQVAQEIIVNNPRLDAILALNTTAAEGAWAALMALGKTGKVKLVGCDQEADLMAKVRVGDIDSVIVENTYGMGSRAIRLLAALKRGEAVPDRIELKPVLVDRTNIDQPDIQRILSMNWRVSR